MYYFAHLSRSVAHTAPLRTNNILMSSSTASLFLIVMDSVLLFLSSNVNILRSFNIFTRKKSYHGTSSSSPDKFPSTGVLAIGYTASKGDMILAGVDGDYELQLQVLRTRTTACGTSGWAQARLRCGNWYNP
jgi:hypothetical protein